MKKTLITLAALAMASTAGAIGYDVNEYYHASYSLDNFAHTTITVDGTEYNAGVLTLDRALTFNSSWELEVTVTVAATSGNNWGTTVFGSGDNPFGNFSNGFQVYQTSSTRIDGLANQTQYKFFANPDNAPALNTGWEVGNTYTFTVSYLADSGVISLDGAGFENISKTISDPANQAAITQLSTGAIGLEGWSIGIKQTVIPEPATATLSLLALAGLAARRRRK